MILGGLGLRRGGQTLLDRLAEGRDPVAEALFLDATVSRVLLDLRGRVRRLNPACAALLQGFDAAPGIAFADLLDEGSARGFGEALAVLARGGAPLPLDLTLAGWRAVDQAQHVTVSLVPLRGPGGGLDALWAELRDMTEERRHLAQAAEARRQETTTRFAAGIAHDVNNLLTAIVAANAALAPLAEGNADAAAAVRDIGDAAERGASLVRRLLAFAPPDGAALSVVAVDAVVAALVTLLPRMLGPSVRLSCEHGTEAPHVRADPAQLDQVVMNLALNARDAMPDGGTLTLRTGGAILHRPLPRHPQAVPAGSYAVIEVEDTGSGIPPDVLPRIFEPFFTTKRRSFGHGLGLATVQAIVRGLGGFLTVDSAVGRGASFRVYFPAVPPPAAQPAPAPSLAPSPAPSPAGALAQPNPPGATPDQAGLVLLVEDDDAVRPMAERALRRAGWTVRAAPTAEEALAALDGGAVPVAVVTDLTLPGMGGLALAAAVRARMGRPDIPVVLVSGYTSAAAQRDIASALGGTPARFLAKPFEMPALVEAVRAEMSGGGNEPDVPAPGGMSNI